MSQCAWAPSAGAGRSRAAAPRRRGAGRGRPVSCAAVTWWRPSSSRYIRLWRVRAGSLRRAPGDLADRGRRRGESPPPAERDPREVHEDGDLDEGPDDGGERLPRRDPEDPDRRRDRELEVVARGREREGRRLLVREPEALGDREGDGEHEEEVEDEGDRDPHDVPQIGRA